MVETILTTSVTLKIMSFHGFPWKWAEFERFPECRNQNQARFSRKNMILIKIFFYCIGNMINIIGIQYKLVLAPGDSRKNLHTTCNAENHGWTRLCWCHWNQRLRISKINEIPGIFPNSSNFDELYLRAQAIFLSKLNFKS